MSASPRRHDPRKVADLEQELGILGRYFDLWTGVLERAAARDQPIEHGGYNDNEETAS